MPEIHQYSIKRNRFRRSYVSGFQAEGDHLLCQQEKNQHVFVSFPLDGIEEGALWGRLQFQYELEEDMVVTVYALASDDPAIYEEFRQDPENSGAARRSFFELEGAVKAVNQRDILLYQQRGRYLYLRLEVTGRGAGQIFNIRVRSQGDIFMETLPEVYREYGSFFHRYLSVFSSLYLDFQERIESVAELFDLDTAPVELLPMFGRWLGLDVSGDFLEEKRLRLLVKEACQLNKMKGTRAALERLTELILGEKAVILEKNVLRDNTQAQEQEIYENLYGSGTYDVTMLIRTYVPENQKSQLMFLIHQFKPVRSRLLIRFLDEKGSIDRHSYLDMNARISEVQVGRLDERQSLDGSALLEGDPEEGLILEEEVSSSEAAFDPEIAFDPEAASDLEAEKTKQEEAEVTEETETEGSEGDGEEL